MNILVATDSFKASLSAQEVGYSIHSGIVNSGLKASIEVAPLADGGEGTAAIIASHVQANEIISEVLNPIGEEIRASWFWHEPSSTAYMDMASASGYQLIDFTKSSILDRNTFGTGQLIRHALNKGAKNIVLGLGGSATCDAGIGMAAALSDDYGPDNITPRNLQSLPKVPFWPSLSTIRITALYDVAIPLLGPSGTVSRYSGQKGANDAEKEVLEAGIQHLVDVSGIKADFPGDGAAGGLGFGCRLFLNAQLKNGFDYLSKRIQLEEKIKKADIVITGEGKVDSQTLDGKVVSGVLKLCQKHNKPTIGVCGQAESQIIGTTLGLESIYQVVEIASDEQDAIKNATHHLTAIGKTIGKSLI